MATVVAHSPAFQTEMRAPLPDLLAAKVSEDLEKLSRLHNQQP